MLDQKIPLLVSLIEDVGAIVASAQASSFQVVKKEDGSPCSDIDLLAHEHICKGLPALGLSDHIISEEGTIPVYEDRKQWSSFWLVDPIDGTRGFISGDSEYAICIAYIQDGVPVLGAIHMPAMKLTYIAAKGYGAYKASVGGQLERLSLVEDASEGSCVIVANFSYEQKKLQQYIKTLEEHRPVQKNPVKSALKFGVLAEGKADLYPKFGPIMEWDIAAGHIILQEVGLQILRLDRSPLQYNSESLRIDGFCAGKLNSLFLDP